jgi:diguanylate cyclase (GGDEF)-like protein
LNSQSSEGHTLRMELPSPKCAARAWICGFALLCIASLNGVAQRYSFRDYTEGLGDLNVNCIAQDSAGYLWVGTENGLYRYDGQSFRQYGRPEGVGARTIQNIFAGNDGTLWVGTTTGIYFQRRDGHFAEVHAPAPVIQFSQRIGTVFASIAPDQVVMADRSGAFLLRRLGPDQWIAEAMKLEGAAIWSVLAGPDGVLWYGCDSDLCRQSGGKTTRLHATLGLPDDQWLHVLLDRNGHIWLRGYAHVEEVLPREGRAEARDLPVSSNAAPYFGLTQDAQGRVVASQGPVFGLWQQGHWRMVTGHNGLPRFDISNLFVDREGSLWIGVVGHGLKRWLGEDRWEAYSVAEGLSDDVVWAALRDRRGRLWISGESGLDWIPAGGDTPRAWKSPGIQTMRAVSLAESGDGAVWLGSAAGNLVRIDPDSLAGAQWKTPEVYRVLADGKDRIWVATGHGLYVVNTRTGDRTPKQVRDAAIGNPEDRFTDLSLDTANHLWAASDQGLFRLDESGWRAIDPSLSGVKPFAVAADRQGNLWATGAFPGIMRLRVTGDRIFEAAHTTRPPLVSEQAVSLYVDHRGWLWVGQDAGLSVYDGHGWRSFTQDDGLVWNDTDALALAEDRDGSMWIGTSGGLSHLIDPQAVPATPPPAPVFSQIAFGDTAVANLAEIPWSARPLAVTVASLSFRDERHIRIRYRLVGLETDWVETSERELRYPRLAPGNYRLQAAAVDGTSGLISPEQEISFRITPRWWQNPFFQFGMGVLGALAVVALWRFRIKSFVEQKRELELAVQRRTEDLEREKGELTRAREQMRHDAEHDGLTGLWNHRIIIERLRHEVDRSLRDGSTLSVILVDLDHFKRINDTFGHPAGDMVLRSLGEIFQSAVRSYDWVGRYGGEEFLIVLPGSNFMGARSRAEQMRLAVQGTHISHEGASIPITASFGVASGSPSSFEAMIQTADTALYSSKDRGRNCVTALEVPAAGTSAGPQGEGI